MPTFFERVRTALAQEGYQVEGDRELGSGGMGIVVLARQVGLDRLVAVKVIRPETHTAVALARFKREAQTLAKFSHPHIVRVLTAGETKDGLPYYVMEHLQGRTLADRLRDGPLPEPQALKLARDLLAALDHAHAHNVVHRDIKPANVFWDGNDAVLVDFGIAKRLPSADQKPDSTYTEPGTVLGTLDYMAPEQRAGGEVTPACDQYSAGLVIYEGYAGRHWFDACRSGTNQWENVPVSVRSVLKRALDGEPKIRWPDTAAFRRKLTTAGIPWRPVVVVGAIAVVTIAMWPSAHGLELMVSSLAEDCAPSRMGTRVATALVSALKGNPDFSTNGPARRSLFDRGPTMWVNGSVCARGDSVNASVTLSLPAGATSSVIVARGDTSHLHDVADTLAFGIMREIWNRENPLDSVLPVKALPGSARSLAAWLVAERLFAQARWGEADKAYASVETVDSTCWLCSWRHAEVDKWLGRPFDSTRFAGVVRHIASFPPRYQTLIRATQEPLRQSLDSLKAVDRGYPGFLPARFMLGDEMYHRGPLIGFSTRDAIAVLQKVVNGRPDFMPAVEHLTWALTAAGEERAARADLERLVESGAPHDFYDAQLRGLLELGVTCRFEASRCSDAISGALAGRGVTRYPDLAAGPRYLMTFDAPEGAVEFGRRFATRTDTPALVESGLVAELSGFMALGLADSARAAARLLRSLGHAELIVLPAELDGALLLLDPQRDDAHGEWPRIKRDLIEHTRSAVSTRATRRRAAWMLLLLAERHEAMQDSAHYRRLVQGEPGRRPLETLLEADRFAQHARIADALRVTDSLTPLQADSLGDPESFDPFFRTVLHLLRAEWYERSQDRDAEVQELQWQENNDVIGRPDGPPQVGDVDWGFRTLARWRQARVLDADNDSRRCELYRAVIREWSKGDVRYRARADSAARRVTALACPGTS